MVLGVPIFKHVSHSVLYYLYVPYQKKAADGNGTERQIRRGNRDSFHYFSIKTYIVTPS